MGAETFSSRPALLPLFTHTGCTPLSCSDCPDGSCSCVCSSSFLQLACSSLCLADQFLFSLRYCLLHVGKDLCPVIPHCCFLGLSLPAETPRACGLLCQCFYNTLLPKCLSKNSNILIDITIIKQAKKKIQVKNKHR